uniref:Katanin p60 ATPase-containing subunit A-like 2 n=1 Tax=Hippocampus comes TaxID=109280 RepID=A0A3Q2XJU5_HIPCM
MDVSYNFAKYSNQAREADELRIEMRKKSLLILIHQHLMSQGYVTTAVALDQEMNGSVKKFEVCENVDLEMVLMEYESYHYVKFQKYPKLVKKVVEPVQTFASRTQNNKMITIPRSLAHLLNLILCCWQERLLKPLSGFSGMSGEMKEFATIIHKDIYLHNPNVRWEDIIGLEDAKRLVKEAIVYPIKYPQLFKGLLSPWKGLLLYGPPGTGKTLLAKAVATECKTTFFNISASSLVSKWRGDSEKLVRVLFELARYHAPSTIFLDEVESMMGQRGSNIVGYYSGQLRYKINNYCFSLELDHGMLRRLEKRILVGLPPEPARQDMIAHWLPPVSSTGELQLKAELNYQLLAQEMKGYSGSDIRLVCKEAAMRQVRKIFEALESNRFGDTRMPAIRLETVTTQDFLEVLAHTKPSVSGVMEKHTAWEKDFESV